MRDSQQPDDQLRENGVVFLPWIGRAYEEGFQGRQLLILGESHYDWPGRLQMLTNRPPEMLTRCIVGHVPNSWGFGRQSKRLAQARREQRLCKVRIFGITSRSITSFRAYSPMPAQFRENTISQLATLPSSAYWKSRGQIVCSYAGSVCG